MPASMLGVLLLGALLYYMLKVITDLRDTDEKEQGVVITITC